MEHVKRGGSYLRVADPGWDDPLSGKYARAAGGRWNPPGKFEVVYLNADVAVARAQVRHSLEPRGIRPEDLAPERGPTLIHTTVPEKPYVDALTDAGLSALGLPKSYPLDERGKPIAHEVCQTIGERARQDAEPGIACRSRATAPVAGEELAYFNRGEELEVKGEKEFSAWFWP